MTNPIDCFQVESQACEVVLRAPHPSPEDGGPCATCAFRPGTLASQSEHTLALVKLCVEGFRPFHCHEKSQLCRGYIAAANLRGATQNEHTEDFGTLADILNDGIYSAKAAQDCAQ